MAPEPLAIPRRLPAEPTWRDRLDTAGRSRRLVPAAVAVRHVRRRAARRWDREPALRDEARARMAAIVAGTAREPELEALARAAVLEDAAWSELFLRPWVLTDGRRVAGLEQLSAALGAGRGVLVSYCHLGPFQGASSAVARAGATPWLLIGPWVALEPQAGDAGRLLERWRGLTTRTGSRPLVTEPGVLEAGTRGLADGEVVCVLFDLPGSMRTTWLGKPVDLASGSARMAHAADALVVPMYSERRGGRVSSTFLAPLDPRDHGDPESLHRALAVTHERLVLRRPEALESPRRPGTWEESAQPDGWRYASVSPTRAAPD